MVLAGVLYAGVGIASAALAGAAASDQMQFFWRLSAFVISGVVLAAHVAYEHLGHRNAARVTACHVSLGAAIGGFLLALRANIHDLGSASGYRPRMLVAFIAWPLLTGVPAFIVALVMAAVLGLKRREV
ncbi:MAG: hypothetical protein ACR2H4_00375 [Pyrinomonadaceae bacterium]